MIPFSEEGFAGPLVAIPDTLLHELQSDTFANRVIDNKTFIGPATTSQTILFPTGSMLCDLFRIVIIMLPFPILELSDGIDLIFIDISNTVVGYQPIRANNSTEAMASKPSEEWLQPHENHRRQRLAAGALLLGVPGHASPQRQSPRRPSRQSPSESSCTEKTTHDQP